MNFVRFTYILFLFFSCSNRDTNQNSNGVILNFSNSNFNTEKLTAIQNDSISNFLNSPGPMYILDNFMVILDLKSDFPLHIINIKENKYLGEYGKKGQGPGEIAHPRSLSRLNQKSFILMDITQQKLVGYHIDSLLKQNVHMHETKISQSNTISFAEIYKNDLFYIDAINFNDRLNKKSLISDSTTAFGYGLVPTLIKKNESDIVKATAASVIVKSKNGKFIFAYKYSPRIEIFNYNKDTWKTIISPKKFEIDYNSRSSGGMDFFAVTEKTLCAYLDISLGDDYFYALFGEDPVLKDVASKGKTIYVFDYEGNPIKKYKLDKDISFFNVHNDSIIYGINYDFIPELLKFKIK